MKFNVTLLAHKASPFTRINHRPHPPGIFRYQASNKDCLAKINLKPGNHGPILQQISPDLSFNSLGSSETVALGRG